MSSSAPAAAAPAATPVGSPTPHTKAYVEPDAVPHPTLNLLQGHPAGHCIQSSLFFASETWCTPLAADINTLLEGFAGAYTLASARAGEAEEGGERESPFEVFRRMWEEQGWSRVHLMGVPDGPRRRPWAESVLRGFLEHIKPGAPPLEQAGGFFGIYTFYATQPLTMEKAHIVVDAPTLDYLLALSATLAAPLALLDPISLPSLDLTYILHSLLAAHSFFLIPTATHLHPPVPSVAIRDAKSRQHMATAKDVLGAEDEMEGMRASRILSLAGDEDEDSQEAWDETRGWNANLRTERRSYLGTKNGAFPRRRTEFDQDILDRAEELTLRALQEAGSAAEGVVPEIATLAGGGAAGLNLFGLVEGHNSSTAATKGLGVFELAMEGLKTQQVVVAVEEEVEDEEAKEKEKEKPKKPKPKRRRKPPTP